MIEPSIREDSSNGDNQLQEESNVKPDEELVQQPPRKEGKGRGQGQEEEREVQKDWKEERSGLGEIETRC